MNDVSNDLDMADGFLSKDGRQRLMLLGHRIKFLARLARPGGEDPVRKWTSQARQEELASGLEALAQQLNLVLGDVLPPGPRTKPAEASAAPGDASAPPPAPEDRPGADRFVFGMTMDQFDTLDRLIQLVTAHGDVVSATDMADFAEGTLTMVGHAIFDEGRAIGEILDEVEDQRLRELGAPPHSSVGEPRAVYAAGPALAGEQPPGALRLPRAGQAGGLRLH
jgi:hypothetical protein